jgi:pimeloyl-ACP methyl ester carboxylesterase
MRELRLEANGLRFRCLAAGPEAGPLALLLHGFPEGAESWRPQLGALGEAGLLAVAPDLRGYGGTDCPDGEEAYRMPHLVADVAGLVAALGRERCHLVGHDWGSLVGWSVASARPDLPLTWSALSVGHPQAFGDAIGGDEDQARRSSYIGLLQQRGKAERVLLEDGGRRLRAFYQAGPRPDAVPAGDVETFAAGHERPGRLTAALNYYRANLTGEGRQAFPLAPGPVTAPTQLLWGDQDPAVGPASARRTADHVAGEYRLEVLHGAGHWLQFERAEEVSALLLDWIGRHRPLS